MKTSQEWYQYFQCNLKEKRINWSLDPAMTNVEKSLIIKSLQAWQLGETSEGTNLIFAASKYAKETDDPYFLEAIKLFIKEEQKHGENLGRYLDRIGARRISHNWGDSLFRKVRGINRNMEIWTVTVITVECAAQLYYKAVHDASNCKLLKQICVDILTDEAPHIEFQIERLIQIAANRKSNVAWHELYKIFFYSTSLVIWLAHKKAFEAGGYGFKRYMRSILSKGRRIFVKLREIREGKHSLEIVLSKV